MKINRNNYEAFLIDYVEGKLDASQVAELVLFLEANPDIREEFEEFENISLQSHNISFIEKENLKKVPIQVVAGIGEENYEQLFVAYYEGDLAPQEQNELLHFLSVNTQLKSEFEIHKHLKIESDQTILYPQADKLKRRPAIAAWWWSGSAVAAAIALFFALFNLLNTKGVIREKQSFQIVHLDPKLDAQLINSSYFAQLSARVTRTVQVPNSANESELITEFEKVNFSTVDSKLIALKLNDDSHKVDALQPMYKVEVMTLASNEPIQKEKKKGLFGRILKRQVELLAEKSLVKQKKDKSGDPTFVRFLDGSITAFNTVTGSEVEMKKAYNKDGELTRYQLEGEVLSLNRNIPGSDKSE